MGSMRRYLDLSPSSIDPSWIYKIERFHYPKKDWLRSHVDQGLRRYMDWRSHDSKNPGKSFKRDDNRFDIEKVVVPSYHTQYFFTLQTQHEARY